MKKLLLLVPLTLLTTSLACAPKKNGNHPMAPKAAEMLKMSAKAGFDYEPNPDNELLEKSFKSGTVLVTKADKAVTVKVNLVFDARMGAFPEGHSGVVNLETVNDGKSALDVKATNDDAVLGKVICEDNCLKIVAWVKVEYPNKNGNGNVKRVAGFGFDTAAGKGGKIIWKTPQKPEQKKK